MKIVVIDTETTGVDDADQVVEVALVKLCDWRRLLSWIIRPTVPINVLARATHHITDD